VGFEVPATALVAMPEGMPPALIVERFDIRERIDDKRMLALEDLCSVLDLPPEAKYDGTMERVARAVRQLSTSPEEDLLIIVKRSLFAWLIADGDMHLKNMAMLKIADPGSQQFRSIRMAQLYDAVTTRVFPRLKRDRLAIKLNGKDDRLRRPDFRALAAIAGLRVADTDRAIDEMIGLMKPAVESIRLPKPLEYSLDAAAMAGEMLDIIQGRIASFA
jgi:serine/threonine-protein kinase HipA